MYVFDQVIVTFSQGVLWSNLGTFFPTPGLWPEAKRAALTQQRMGAFCLLCVLLWRRKRCRL